MAIDFSKVVSWTMPLGSVAKVTASNVSTSDKIIWASGWVDCAAWSPSNVSAWVKESYIFGNLPSGKAGNLSYNYRGGGYLAAEAERATIYASVKAINNNAKIRFYRGDEEDDQGVGMMVPLVNDLTANMQECTWSNEEQETEYSSFDLQTSNCSYKDGYKDFKMTFYIDPDDNYGLNLFAFNESGKLITGCRFVLDYKLKYRHTSVGGALWLHTKGSYQYIQLERKFTDKSQLLPGQTETITLKPIYNAKLSAYGFRKSTDSIADINAGTAKIFFYQTSYDS